MSYGLYSLRYYGSIWLNDISLTLIRYLTPVLHQNLKAIVL